MKFNFGEKVVATIHSAKYCKKDGRLPDKVVNTINELIEIVHKQQEEINKLKQITVCKNN